MNELLKLIRRHYERNEAGASLLSKVSKILDSLPAGSVDSLQLAGLDQFHVMGLAATEQLAQIAGIERGATILDAGSGLGGPSRYLDSTYSCRVIGVDLSPAYGDLVAAILAVLAIWSLSARAWFASSLVWVFNVWGAVDLLVAFYQGLLGVRIDPGSLGAAFFIPTVVVPPLLVTHGLMFWLLLRKPSSAAPG
jgi:SAM-dependent methyltransferase